MAGNELQYVEFRGVDNLVYAEVTKDTSEAYETGDVKVLSGAGEISKTTSTSSATSHYDNGPRIVTSSEGSDEITVTCSVPTLAVMGELTGKAIDTETGAFIDTAAEPKYFALGYRFKKTDGTYRYIWRLKGMFSIPDEASKTTDDGTDTNNIQLKYTGIMTTHEFTVNGAKETAKGVVVDESDGKCDVSTFFAQVTTPDDLQAKSGGQSVNALSMGGEAATAGDTAAKTTTAKTTAAK